MSIDQKVDTPEMLKGFDALAEKTLQDFACAGAAVAVIKDGAVVLSKGYGYRNIETKEPVDSDTLFAIGSASKAFTAFGLGMLADQNKICWDQPVKKYMPAFGLSDAYASEHTTPRDLLSHRTGFPGHELTWYNSLLTRADLLKRLPHLGLHHPFRSNFQYANLMFLAAGCLIEEVAQKTWEEYTRENIFKPLGMQRSNFSVKDSMKDANAAQSYLTENSRPKLVPFRDLDAMGPAGSINSCLNDMVKWVSLHLEQGKFNGSQLISEKNLEQILTPVIPTPRSFNAEYFNYPGLGVMTYGLGWFINDYRGHRLVNHGGSIDGFLACISFMPEEGLGVICLTNQGNSVVPYLLAYSAYDRLLGLTPFDWGERMIGAKKKFDIQTNSAETQKETPAQEQAPQPTRPLDAYTGDYENPGYGLFKVELEDGALKARYNLWESALLPHGFDAFILKDLSAIPVLFAANFEGDIASVSIPFEPDVKEIVFTRVKAITAASADFLKACCGKYEMADGSLANVRLSSGNQLSVTVPSLPEFELEQISADQFKVKSLPAIQIKFISDDAGQVPQFDLMQPGSITVVRRIAE